MRREKTMKICANFYLKPSIALKENAGSDRSWVWQCADFSEEKSELSVLAIRFATSESALRHGTRLPQPLPTPPPPHPARLRCGLPATREGEVRSGGTGDVEKQGLQPV